jgi:hypothetical protein
MVKVPYSLDSDSSVGLKQDKNEKRRKKRRVTENANFLLINRKTEDGRRKTEDGRLLF